MAAEYFLLRKGFRQLRLLTGTRVASTFSDERLSGLPRDVDRGGGIPKFHLFVAAREQRPGTIVVGTTDSSADSSPWLQVAAQAGGGSWACDDRTKHISYHRERACRSRGGGNFPHPDTDLAISGRGQTDRGRLQVLLHPQPLSSSNQGDELGRQNGPWRA